jgi:hypothetical protein
VSPLLSTLLRQIQALNSPKHPPPPQKLEPLPRILRYPDDRPGSNNPLS